MKLTKLHRELLAEVDAGNVWRTGGYATGVSTVERPGKRPADVTVPMAALHREFLVTLGRATTANPRKARRAYVLTARGEANRPK